MPDEIDLLGPGDDPRNGDEASRRRFLRDVLFFLRNEMDKFRNEIKETLQEFEKRSSESRPRDIDDGLRRFFEIKAEDMPEVRALIQSGLQIRRDRRERIAELWSATRGITLEIVKHAVTSAIVAGAAYYGYSEWFR